MPDLDVTHEPRGDRLIVRLRGELRPHHAEDFDAEIQRIADQDPEIVVLDLEHLGFIGSAGIGALVRLDKALRKQDTRVRIANASPQIQTLFERSRLDDVFPLFDNVQQALA